MAIFNDGNILGLSTSTPQLGNVGKVGLALSVRGNSEYAQINPIPSSLQLTGNLSLESWINVGTLSDTFTTAWIVREKNSTTTNYALRVETDKKVGLYYASDTPIIKKMILTPKRKRY